MDDGGEDEVVLVVGVLVGGDDDGEVSGGPVGACVDEREPVAQPVVGGCQRAVVRVVGEVGCDFADVRQSAVDDIVVQRPGGAGAGWHVAGGAGGAGCG